ncbi:MAG: hypothetical protein QHJ34_14750 [bacterium]|jgi:hypothetical protein|nr:hypothetical protein [candidate division KSB1 bacterium]MDH7561460.1 hypothetical protein [bacterium]
MVSNEQNSRLPSLWESLDANGGEAEASEFSSFLSSLGEPRLIVVGVGGRGCHWVSQLASGSPHEVELVAADTDLTDLHNSLAHRKVLLGEQVAGGQGCGGELLIGKAAAMESSEELRSLCQKVEVMVIACAPGGGTGSGAAPVLAGIAHQEGLTTIAVVPAQPPRDASAERCAADGVARLRDEADILLSIADPWPQQQSEEAERRGSHPVVAVLRHLQPRLGEESPLLAAIRQEAAGQKLTGHVAVSEGFNVGDLQAALHKGLRAGEECRFSGPARHLFCHIEGEAHQAAAAAAELAEQPRKRVMAGVEVSVTFRPDEHAGNRLSLIACVMEPAAAEASQAEAVAEEVSPPEPEPWFDVRQPQFALACEELLAPEATEPEAAAAPLEDFLRRLRSAIDGVLRDQGGSSFAELAHLCQEADLPAPLRQEVVAEILKTLGALADRWSEGTHSLAPQERALLGRVPSLVASLCLGAETAVVPARTLAAELGGLLHNDEGTDASLEEAPSELFAEGSALDLLAV